MFFINFLAKIRLKINFAAYICVKIINNVLLVLSIKLFSLVAYIIDEEFKIYYYVIKRDLA